MQINKSPHMILALIAAVAFLVSASLLYLLYPNKRIIAPLPFPLAYPFLASPHFDERPQGITINAVIVHATTIDSLQESVSYFLEPSTEVSTHFVVGRDGTVVQIVPVEKRAWHAGLSILNGVEHVNDFSVGIEMVNLNDGVEAYPEVQYEAVAGIIRLLRSRYQIPDERILSHAEVATPPGRKSDPIGFNLNALRAMTHNNTTWSLPSSIPTDAAPASSMP
jgi:N-acetylmuramoyl-L-alanine amidase